MKKIQNIYTFYDYQFVFDVNPKFIVTSDNTFFSNKNIILIFFISERVNFELLKFIY